MSRNRFALAVAVGALLLGAPSVGAQTTPALDELSLEALLNVEVSSAARRTQTIARTAAAVHVVTAEDIHRSGAQTLAEALRLVPGVWVQEINANTWSVTARGFSGVFADKLLVLIDGRSIYSPISGGVEWEHYRVPLDSIERIEVIRGPGGAVWGSNALNGVVNVITKPADQLQGTQATLRTGSYTPTQASLGYGGRLGTRGYFASRAEFTRRRTPGLDVDGLDGGYADMQFAWRAGSNQFIAAGEFQTGSRKLLGSGAGGGTTTQTFDVGSARFAWTQAASSLRERSVQGYVSRYGQRNPDLGKFATTIDVDARQRLILGRVHDVVFGAEYRFLQTTVEGTPVHYLEPAERNTHLLTAFVQDEITVGSRVFITPGLKAERNGATGVELQPTVRFLWMPTARQSIWTAVTRAVRTPTRYEREMRLTQTVERAGSLPLVLLRSGNPDYVSETARVLEVGYRVQRGAAVLDASAFLADNDRLLDLVAGAPFVAPVDGVLALNLPQTIGNTATARTAGVELAGSWRPLEAWDLNAGATWFDAPSLDPTVPTNGPVPRYQFHLQSHVSVGPRVGVTATASRVSGVPDMGLEAYERLDLTGTWSMTPQIALSLGAKNLFRDGRPEYLDLVSRIQPVAPRRELFAQIAWKLP